MCPRRVFMWMITWVSSCHAMCSSRTKCQCWSRKFWTEHDRVSDFQWNNSQIISLCSHFGTLTVHCGPSTVAISPIVVLRFERRPVPLVFMSRRWISVWVSMCLAHKRSRTWLTGGLAIHAPNTKYHFRRRRLKDVCNPWKLESGGVTEYVNFK